MIKLEEFKSQLNQINNLAFTIKNGEQVPNHFHITEVGKLTRHFIDCGGKEREKSVINFQLYVANDVEHRLAPSKLLGIIKKSERALNLENLEIEVEYQTTTIGKYNLDYSNGVFELSPTHTDCLAKDNCGIPELEIKENLTVDACCEGSGCC